MLSERLIGILTDQETVEANLAEEGLNTTDQLETIVSILAAREIPLHYLDLSGNNITDELVKSLCDINVKHLRISINEIHNEGARFLDRECPKVTVLNLSHNFVDDEGALSLMTSNKRITLAKNSVSPEVLLKFNRLINVIPR